MFALNPLESTALRQELPALEIAFDARAAREYFESGLLDPSHTITACELKHATYVPGQCCVLRYGLEVEDRTSGRKSFSLVTGRVFASEPACHAYLHDRLAPLVAQLASRNETIPFAKPAAVIGPLRMAVYAFPIDGELPMLIGATDQRRVARILNETLPAAMRHAAPIETCQVELVRYRHPHCATLRYLLDGQAGDAAAAERVVYGKLTAGSSGALAGPITSALRERSRHSGFCFNVPAVFAWVPDLHLSLLGAIPGTPLIARALKARHGTKPEFAGALSPEEMVEACARISATVHTSGLDLGPRRTLEDELLGLSQQIGEVRRLSPELGLHLEGWLWRLSACAGRSKLACGLCHGDYTPAQVLFEGRESGLVDFDSVCQGEPALDLGQFLAYLTISCMKAAGAQTSVLADQLRERFLRVYIAASGNRAAAGRLAERTAIYKVVSLLRRAVRSWLKFKPGEVEVALSALARC